MYHPHDLRRFSDALHSNPRQRKPYSHDTASEYGRIVHSMSFRRLQGKMQLFPPSSSPVLRNRLTHTLEVADIASRIVAGINEFDKGKTGVRIDGYIVAAASLAHDLGHPPFGHTGEQILAELMHNYGSFEGNAQTLRIITKLENRFVEGKIESAEKVHNNPLGLDLMFRTIASIIKYDKLIPIKPEKPYDPEKPLQKGFYEDDQEIVTQIKRNILGENWQSMKLRTIECQIMDIADDIAYSTYDLEDCMLAGIVNPLDLISVSKETAKEIADKITITLKRLGYTYTVRASDITTIYEKMFYSIIETTDYSDYEIGNEFDGAAYLGWNYRNSLDLAQNNLRRRKLTETLINSAIRSIRMTHFNKLMPSLSSIEIDVSSLLFIEALKHYNYIHTIMGRDLQLYAQQAKVVLNVIFDAIKSDKSGALLPAHWKQYYCKAAELSEQSRMRAICDYISSLTDAEAIDVYSSLRAPNFLPDFGYIRA